MSRVFGTCSYMYVSRATGVSRTYHDQRQVSNTTIEVAADVALCYKTSPYEENGQRCRDIHIYIYIYNADDLRRWLRIISWKLLEDGANQSEPPDQKAEKHRPITSSNPRNPKNAATDPFKTPPAPCGAKGTRLSASYSENAVIVMNTTSSPCRS